jgi:hypothetical protein
MPLPVMDEASRKRPLCYDPVRKKFIYYDQIVSGEEKIISLDVLTEAEFEKLVIKRLQALPKDTKYYTISGLTITRDDMIQSIQQGNPDGLATLQMERSYLAEFLEEIQNNLP